jgi:phospholipase C
MANALAAIKNVVVLMLENRSLDHMLGYLRSAIYPIEGLTGAEYNLEDPLNPASAKVLVNNQANYQGDLRIDPAHDTLNVNVQLFSSATPAPGAAPANQGFVLDYAQVGGNTPANTHKIMNCFAPGKLPALQTLAQEFALCDHWHASVPGQTWPNRFFVHAGTSDGWLDNKVRYYGMRTIYDNLSGQGVSWNIYFHDVPQSLALARLQVSLFKDRFKLFDHFLKDAASGQLPAYSFIEPRYNDFLFWKANDEHPDHDVSLGDALIANVYEALRSSPQWNQNLLVILYDEHGGIFDHVPPPGGPPYAVNPDGKNSTSPPFNFDRLGVRVPAVLVSPYIAKGTIDHLIYDHTSLLATVKKIFKLPTFLTRRDAAAATFENNLALDQPRTDAPIELPRAAPTAKLAQMNMPVTLDNVNRALAAGEASQAPLTELQRSLVDLASSLDAGESHFLAMARAARVIETEHEAAVHTQETVARFLGWH